MADKYNEAIKKYSDMLYTRKENGDIDITKFLPDINEMIKEDCVWDIYKKIKDDNGDKNIEDTAYYVENPPLATPGYYEDSQCFVLRPSINALDIDAKGWELGYADGDTWPFDLDELDVGGSFTINGKKYNSFKDYAIANQISCDKISIRAAGIDASEICHYTPCLVSNKDTDIVTMSYEQARLKGYTVMPYKLNKNGSKDPSKWTMTEYKNNDQITFLKYQGSFFQIAKDMKASDYISPKEGYTGYVIVSNGDWGRETLLDGYKAQARVKELVTSNKIKDMIVMVDRNTVVGTKISGTRNKYYNSFVNNYKNINLLVKELFTGDVANYNTGTLDFEPFGCDNYGRMLGNVWIKLDDSDGDYWINLSKYVMAGTDYTENNPNFAGTSMAGIYGGLSSEFKSWTNTSNEFRYVDALNTSGEESYEARIALHKRLTGIDFKTARDHTVLLGDTLLLIPPESIHTASTLDYEKLPILRGRGSMMKNKTNVEELLELELYFNNEYGINGIPYQFKTPNGTKLTYYMNGLRSLIAQFRVAPFLPIENHYINDVLNIEVVSLVNMSITTVEGFPKLLKVVLTLREFNYRVFMPDLPVPDYDSSAETISEMQHIFAKQFDWDLFRYYYQRGLINGETLSSYTYNTYAYNDFFFSHKNNYTRADLTDSNIEFFIPDVEWLKYALQVKKARDQYGNMEKTDESDIANNDYKVSVSGEYVKTVNNGIPNFKGSELSTICVERYSELDMLGRCGPAFAILGKDTMPKDGASRGDISSVTPSGWNQKSYSSIKTDNNTTGSLYNRCHLIGWQLSAENANAKNLITGTAWMNSGDYSDDPNTGGMLYYENKVAKYLKSNPSKHVAYRVTPHFQGDDLVATSVQMEAYSIEDQGASICFNVEIANVQPGIEINYSDGSSKKGTDNKKEIEYNYYDYKDPRNMVFVPYLMDDKGASIPLELDSISVNMSNYFTETHLKACDGYAPQYMGGSDVGIEIRATITDEYYIGVLKNLPHVIMNMIRNYRRVMPCFPLKIKNDYLQMLGVNEVVLENISVSTKPGFPGVFDVVIKLSSMDRSMRQREALQKVDHNGITSANAALNIYSYFNLQESLAQAELYPDLDLPTIQELTDLGWKFAKWSNEDRVYVDPDFYICYSFAYSSKLIKEVINNILYRVIYPSDSQDSQYNIANSDSATHTLTAMQLVDNYNIAMKVHPGKENNGLEVGQQNGYALLYDQVTKQISAKAHDDNTIKKKVSNKPTEEQVKTTISTLEYLTALGIENGWQVKPGWYAPICSEYINKEMEKYPYAGIVQMPKKVNEEDYDQFIRDIYDMRHRAIMLINRILDKPLSTSQTSEVDPCVSAWDAVQAVFGTDDGQKLLDLLCPMIDYGQNDEFTESKVEGYRKNDDKLRMTTEYFEQADPIRWLQGLLYALACCRSGQEEYGDGKSENAWKARQWNDQADLAEQQQTDGLNYFAIPYNKVQQGRGIAGDGILATSEESALTDGISYGAGQLTIYNVETIKTIMQPESKIKYFNKKYLSGASENYNHMYYKTRAAGRDKFCETGFIDLYYNFAGYKSVEGKDYIEKISKSQTCNYEALLREVLMHLKRLIMDGYIFSEVDVVAQDWDTVLAEVLGEGENLETILADSENVQKGNMYTMGLYEQSMINKAAASEGGLEQELEDQNENKQYKEIAAALKEEIPKSYARLFCVRLTYAFAMASCNGDINLVNLLKARNYDELDTYTLSSLVGGANNDKFNKFLGCMYGIGMIGSSNLTDSAEITSNTQKAFNTLMSEAYTEMANDPKCYVLHSYYDMCVSDKRGRLLRAFPTYYMFFIDEGRAIGSWRLFDNFYNMSSISNIQVVKSRKMPADTCTFTMSNMFTSYADHYDNTIYNQYVNEYGFKDTYYSVFAPREYVNREDARRKRKELTDTTAITPGVRIHVRMGYGSDGSKLPIVFNGKIAEIGCGEVVEIVAQGDGHELCNPLNALGDLTAINLDESQSWTTMFKDIRGSLARGGQTPRNLLAKLATAQHGGVIKSVIREVSNGRWYYDNPFGIYHFGDKRYKDIFEDSEIVQNMYEVSNKTMLNGTNDLLEDMSTVNAAPLLNCNIQDKTMWEIGHLCANSGDDFYFAVRDFGLRSTMCLCRANHYYAFEYRRDDSTGVVGERRKPFQQFHYYDSYNDIIYNTFKASESNMKTNAVGTWEGTDYLWGTSQQSVGPIYLDMNIYPEYQKSMTVETGLVAGGDGGIDIPIFNALAEKYNYNEYAGRVNKSLAEKVTTNVLRQSVKDMYEGEICIIADPSLKPYDRVTLVDVYEDMTGDVEVETVIHSMNIETGFTTTFIPDLIVRVENTAQECGCQSVMANITLGIVSSVTLKGAVAAAATKGIDGLAKMGTKSLIDKTTAFAGKKAAGTVIGNLLKGVGSAAGKVGIFANPIALASVAVTATCVFMLAQSAKEMFTRFCRNIQALTVFPITKNGKLLIAGMSGHKGSVYGFPYSQEQAKDSIQGFIMDFTSLNYDSFALDCIGTVFDWFLTDSNYQVVKNRWMNNLGLTDNEDIMQDDASDTRNQEAFIQFLSHAISTEYASRAVMLASLKTKPRISSFNTDNRTNDIYLKYQIGGIHDKTSKQIGKLEVDETMTKAVSASELKTNERIKRLLPVEDDPDIKIARISNTHPVVKQFLFAHSKSPLTFDLKMEDENTAIRYIAEGGGKTKVFDLPMLQEDAMMVLKLILNMDNLKGKTVTFLSGTRVNDTNSWKSTGFWFALHCDDMKALEAASKEVREDSSWHEGKKSFAYRVDSDCIQYTVYAPNDITNSQFFRSDHIGDD